MIKTIFATIFLSLSASAQLVMPSPFISNGCQQQIDPHTFECHEATFNAQTEFQVVPMDIFGSLQNEWFAVTYAVRGGNSGAGFFMDKNPFRPSRPGKGVFNQFKNGSSSLMGSLFIQGQSAVFTNWQGAQMFSLPGSFKKMDLHTVSFDMNDQFGILHTFQCRDFIRNGAHHLTCRWLLFRPQTHQWEFIGYFGFLTRQVWDQFVLKSQQH